jgi:cytochrome c5
VKRVEQVMLACLLLATAVAVGQTDNAPRQPDAQNTRRKAQPAESDRGQEVFHQNCYRCHQEPEGFPPSISGTIAKHMRVRAGLSGEDYKALLKFLNP